MSDKSITDALDKIGAGLTTLVELAQAGGTSGAEEEAEAPSKSTATKKKTASKKKGTRKKKAAAKKPAGPTIDEARAVCLELVETVDEYGEEDEDGNEVLKELIGECFDGCSKLSDIEGSGENFQAIMDAAREYIAENYPDEDED